MPLVYLGKHPKYYNSEGNRRLKEIVREMLPAYVDAREKNTRAAKTRILKETLERANSEDLQFVTIVGGQHQNAKTEDSHSKISHLFRDMIISQSKKQPDTVRSSGAPRTKKKARKRQTRNKVENTPPTKPPRQQVANEKVDNEIDNFMNDIDDLDEFEKLLGLSPLPIAPMETPPSAADDESIIDQQTTTPSTTTTAPDIGLPFHDVDEIDISLEDIEPIAVENIADASTEGSRLEEDRDLYEAIDTLFPALL